MVHRGPPGAVEAQAGRDFLVEQGVPADSVWMEARSRHTLENLFNVRATMRSHGWRKLILISDPLHLPRAGGQATAGESNSVRPHNTPCDTAVFQVMSALSPIRMAARKNPRMAVAT